MARIKLDFPQSVLFQTEIPVRITDLNYGAHVGNDTFLRYLQEARAQLVKSWGYGSETDIEGVGLIMGDVAVSYRAEAFYGDVLRVEVGVQDVTEFTFDFVYRITQQEGGKLVTLAKTGMVCFDYQERSICDMPAGLKRRLSAR